MFLHIFEIAVSPKFSENHDFFTGIVIVIQKLLAECTKENLTLSVARVILCPPRENDTSKNYPRPKSTDIVKF